MYYIAKSCTPVQIRASKRGVCPDKVYSLPECDAALSAFSGVLTGSPSWLTEDFGYGMHDYSTGELPPPPLEVDIGRSRTTSKSSFKDFETRRKAGEIVIRPMNAFEASAIVHPVVGGVKSTPYKMRGNFGIYKTEDDRFNPCTGGVNTAAGWMTEARGRYNKIVVPLNDHYYGLGVGVTYDKTWDTIPNPLFVSPEPGIAYAIHNAVMGAILAEEQKRGLITAAVSEANSGIYDLLTELGEMQESITYVFGFLQDIIRLVVDTKKAIKNVTKRPGKSAAQIADEIASIWLQFRYAVMPLAYSANDILDAVSSIYSPYETFRKGEEFDVKPELEGWSIPALKVVDRVWIKFQYSADIRLHKIKMDPLSTAWELFPLSFVVDWVLNVGDFLSALRMPSNVHQRAVQYSRQVKDATLSCVGPDNQRVEYRLRYYDAEPINPLARIGLTIDPSMTWKRWLDAIALSWGMSKNLLKG